MQQQDPGSFMDVDYEYEGSEQDFRHRPQSRASQHSSHGVESGNGRPSQATGSHHRRTQQQQQQRVAHDPQLASPYQYQQSQFDEPTRAADDDMW